MVRDAVPSYSDPMAPDDASHPAGTSTAHTRPDRLGVIGLGAMGLPMASHLLAAHGALTVHSRTPKPELERAGARWAATPRELAEHSDTVLVMLPDLPQLEPMLTGPDSLLASGTSLLLMIGSTCSPVALRDLAARLSTESDGRVRVLDCPVSGGDTGARSGNLSIMAGGTDEDADRAARLLAPCGTLRHLGPLGAGEVTKACNQMIVGATMLALADATVLAQRSGIAPSDLFDALSGGYAGSRLLEDKRSRLEDDDVTPGGIAAYMAKDLRFAAEVATDTHTRASLLPRLQEMYDELLAAGLGQDDLAVAKRFVAER